MNTACNKHTHTKHAPFDYTQQQRAEAPHQWRCQRRARNSLTHHRLALVRIPSSRVRAVGHVLRVEVVHKTVRSVVDCEPEKAHVVGVEHPVREPNTLPLRHHLRRASDHLFEPGWVSQKAWFRMSWRATVFRSHWSEKRPVFESITVNPFGTSQGKMVSTKHVHDYKHSQVAHITIYL